MTNPMMRYTAEGNVEALPDGINVIVNDMTIAPMQNERN